MSLLAYELVTQLSRTEIESLIITLSNYDRIVFFFHTLQKVQKKL